MKQLINRIIIKQLDELLDRAYCPYSKFKVACVLESDHNALYCGFNIENASYPCTTCAEVAAVSNFLINKIKSTEKIITIYLKTKLKTFSTPCGKCRQVLIEHISENSQVYIVNSVNAVDKHLLGDFLPLSFKFNDNQPK